MEQEIEAKFLRVDLEDVRVKLDVAATRLVTPMAGLRRVILETPELRSKEAFVRVRDEGNKVTAAYKRHADLSFGGAREIEIVVDDFETAVKLFEATGLVGKSYQETKREVWSLNGATITIDMWPWLDPLVEIEAKDQESVKAAAAALEFNWKDAVFGGIMIAYQRQYPNLAPEASIIDLPEVKFDMPLPDMLK